MAGPCYCGCAADQHMTGPPWPDTPRVAPDRDVCTDSRCPCDGYEEATAA